VNWAARFVVHDEEGPVRTFWTRQEAVNWMCGRAEMWLEVRPAVSRRELQRQMLEESELAVF
jgi:hypothetical protein